ncbi:MAG: hypothetical protein HYV39_00475 [Candidatus Levybacteria bacterium]|nr:hypothetical protein [Candidatus Levybacteria bacterium]
MAKNILRKLLPAMLLTLPKVSMMILVNPSILSTDNLPVRVNPKAIRPVMRKIIEATKLLNVTVPITGFLKIVILDTLSERNKDIKRSGTTIPLSVAAYLYL